MKIKIINKLIILISILVVAVECFNLFFNFTDAQTATQSAAQNNSPRQIEVTAYIVNNENKEIANGEYEVRFSFYRMDRIKSDPYPSDTDPKVWDEIQKVRLKNGIMQAYVGAVTPLPASVDFSLGGYYLGIRIGEDSEMTPRKKIGAVPLAINALDAGTVAGAAPGTSQGNLLVLGKSGKVDVKRLSTGTSGKKLALANDSRFHSKVSLSGDYDYLTLSGQDITLEQIDLTTDVAGTLPIANGGTNAGSIGSAGSVAWSTGSAYSFSAVGTTGQILLSGGGGSPTWGSIGGGAIDDDSLDFTEFKDAMTLDAATDVALAGNNFTFSGTGNVGIGTIAPTQKFQVNDTAMAAFVVTSAGQVGIGTTAPSTKLDVSGSVRFYDQTATTGSTTLSIRAGAGQATSPLLALKYDDSNYQNFTMGSDGSLYIAQDGGAATFTLSNDRVGIGTTSPDTFELEVAGDIGPEANNTRNLGSADRYFNTAYITNLITGTSGTVGYWNRTGTTLSPATNGDALAIYAGSGNTSGTLLSVAYNDNVTLDGKLIGAKLDLNDGYVNPVNQDVTGLWVVLPTTTNTNAAGTVNMSGMSLGYGAGSGINQNGAGSTVYSGINLILPALTQTAGALNVNGVYVDTPHSITTGGTASGVYINSYGVGAGILNGLFISDITGSTGAETALNIGSGWDSVLKVNGIQIINGSGVVQSAGGGTGQATWTKGDVLISDANDSLAKLGIGATGQVLAVGAGGVPLWGVISGSSCTNCLVSDPSSDQVIVPTNDSSGLIVRQTATGSPTADIFAVASNNGLTKYFYVDASGVVNIPDIGSSSGDQLTIEPGSDKYALKLLGTNVTGESLALVDSYNTSGIIFDIDYPTATVLAGFLTGVDIDLSTNLTVTNQSVTGQKITMPIFTNTNTTGTKNYYGIQIALPVGGGVNQNGAGASAYYGLDIASPALTQTAGTLTSYGINITTPTSITTGGTAYGININSFGVGAGSLYGLNVGNITAGAGSEYGAYIGTGWDFGVYSATANTNYFAGNVGIGTTAPGAKLDIYQGSLVLSDDGVAHGMTALSPANSFFNVQQIDANQGGAIVYGFTDSDATALAIKGVIGTSNPSDTRPALTFEGAKYDDGTGRQALADAETVMQFRNYQTNLVTILGSGNVGIGTTSPTVRLNVLGVDSLATSFAANISGATGTGLVVNNLGNVGIGTTTPGAKLHLAGTDAANGMVFGDTADVNLYRAGANQLKTDDSFIVGGDHYISGDELFFNGGQADLVLESNSASNQTLNLRNIGAGNLNLNLEDGVLQVDGTGNSYIQGNVGIGTTNPFTKLHIVGNSETPTGTYYGVIRIDTITGTNDVGYKLGAKAGAGTAGYSFIQAVHTDVANDANLSLNPSGGNVGIGTTTPLEKLQVYGGQVLIGNLTADRNNALAVRREDSGNVISATRVASDVEALLIRVDTNTPSIVSNAADLNIGYGGTYGFTGGLTIKNTSGNVGIGTTAPGAKLDVNGDINIQTGSGASKLLLGTATEYITSNTGSAALDISTRANVRIIGDSNNNDAATDPVFGIYQTSTANNLVSVLKNGNVGIGTTSPTVRLNVLGVDSLATSFAANISGATGTGLVVNNLGNVGIGTTGPGAKLHLSGTGNTALNIESTSADTSAWLMLKNDVQEWMTKISGAESDAYVIRDNTLGREIFKIYPGASGSTFQIQADSDVIIQNGNVGIGTTGPGAKLQITKPAIVGSSPLEVLRLEIEDQITPVDTQAGMGPKLTFYIPESSATFEGAYIAAEKEDNSDINEQTRLTFATAPDAGTATERMRITSGGNVGIGTTTPGAKLEVSQSGAATSANYGSTIYNTATSSTDSINKYGLYVSSTGTWNGIGAVNYGLYVAAPTGGTANVTASFAGSLGNVSVNGNGAALEFSRNDANYITATGASGSLGLQTGGANTRINIDSSGNIAFNTSQMYIRQSDGNVGIGTTIPARTLEVNGSIRMGALITGAGSAVAVYRDVNGDLADSTSSILYKTDVSAMENVLPRLMSLSAVRFKWGENTSTPGEKDFGMIAENVNNILPDLVTYNPDGSPRGLKYEKMGVFALKGIQELDTQIFGQMNVLGDSLRITDSQGNVQTFGNRDISSSQNREMTLSAQDINLDGHVFANGLNLNTAITGLASSANELADNQNKIVSQLAGQLASSANELADESLSINEKLNLIGENLDDLKQDEKTIADLKDQFKKQNITLDDLKSQVDALDTSNQAILSQIDIDALIDLAVALNTDLMLYKDVAGNINIGSGKIIADSIQARAAEFEGGVVAGAFTVKIVDHDAPTIGSACIAPFDETSDDSGKDVFVETKAITENSRIFVTPKSVIAEPLAVTKTTAGSGFKVEMKTAIPTDSDAVCFDWWVVEEE